MIITLVKQNDEFSRGRDFTLIKTRLRKQSSTCFRKDFKIFGNGFGGNNKKRKVAEVLLILEIKPNLNIQDQSVPLQLFS